MKAGLGGGTGRVALGTGGNSTLRVRGERGEPGSEPNDGLGSGRKGTAVAKPPFP